MKKLTTVNYAIVDDKNNIVYFVTLKYSDEYGKFVPIEVVFEYNDDMEVFETTDDLVYEYPDIDQELINEIDETLEKLWNKKISLDDLKILL